MVQKCWQENQLFKSKKVHLWNGGSLIIQGQHAWRNTLNDNRRWHLKIGMFYIALFINLNIDTILCLLPGENFIWLKDNICENINLILPEVFKTCMKFLFSYYICFNYLVILCYSEGVLVLAFIFVDRIILKPAHTIHVS